MQAKLILPAVALGLFCASAAGAQQPDLLACRGPLARDGSEVALAKAFGAGNVTRAAIDVGEGMTQPGTILFAKDPKRRIDILWHDGARRSRPATISVAPTATWRIAVPDAEPPIRMGMSLAQVEAANGRPFEILGFGWDRGGHAGDWKGGRLAKPDGGCELSLRFEPEPGFLAMDAISGDRPFSSADARIRAVKPVVVEVRLRWP
jgi:hypothetical protein